jgi:hypothetical protein
MDNKTLSLWRYIESYRRFGKKRLWPTATAASKRAGA